MAHALQTAVLAPGSASRRLRWLTSAAPTILLAAAWIVSYLGGGSHTALPHLFYLPILLAGVALGVRGGALAGLVAAVLCGPLLPLDVATGESQVFANWIARGAFFVGIGAMTGAAVQNVRRGYEAAIERTLTDELRPRTAGTDTISSATNAEVRRLLDARAFHIVFQPIHRLDDGRIVAVEALTRFHSEPYRPPDHWFDRAAAAGMGVELELATAEAALVASHGVLPDALALNINVSPHALIDPRLLTLLDAHRDRSVVLEVTEHAIVDDYHDIDRALVELRSRGARLAVDDAGAGFSSLRHIVRLAPEIIKLDLSLTQGLGTDPVRAALADCLVGFARRTSTLLVAEGIEHPSDLETWRELGADAAQGYLLGRPTDLAVLQLDHRDSRRPV